MKNSYDVLMSVYVSIFQKNYKFVSEPWNKLCGVFGRQENEYGHKIPPVYF